MNKWLVIVSISTFTLFFIVSPVFAQPDITIEEVDEAMGTDEYAKKGFSTQRIFTGGNIGLGFGSTSANFEISPQLGYRITDHFHFGLSMTYIYQSVKNFGGGSTHFTAFGGGPFIRYLLINFEGMGNNYGKETGLPMSGIYAAVEFTRLKGNTNLEGYIFDGENAFFIGLGYTSNYYRGFSYFFQIAYNVIWKETFENSGGQTQGSFYPWPVAPKAGLYYGF